MNDETRKSYEQHVLEQVYKVVCSEQVTRKRMECTPQWVLDKSLKTELDDNWAEAYIPVNYQDVSRGANVISSHFFYNVKQEEVDTKRLKARLFPHGSRDRMI